MLQRALMFGILFLGLGAGWAQAHENSPAQISNLTHLLEAHPSDPSLYLQRGALYRLGGNWSAAEADCATARSLGADASQVAVCLAALELSRGNPTTALAYLQEVDAVGPSALFVEGRALRRLGQFREAATVLGEAVASSPRPRPEDYLELSDVVLEQGDPYIPEALEILDAGLRRLGPVVSLTLATVDLEVRRGDHASALHRMRSAPPGLQKSPAWITRQGEILLRSERDLEAQVVFTEALSLLQALPPHRRSVPAMVTLETKLRGHLSTPPRALSGTVR